MARAVERLTALGAARLKAPGYYPDGAGLYLQVSPSGSKSWVFRYTFAKRPREMGLGSFTTFSLAEARARAKASRQLLADGIDPIARRDEVAAAATEATRKASSAITFGKAADRYIAAHEAGWKNAKHTYQWHQTIDTYAKPLLGDLPISAIDTDMVVKVLEPIWTTKTETAT